MQTTSYLYSEHAGSVVTAASPLSINSESPALAVIIRILSGTANITNRHSDETIDADINYFLDETGVQTNRDLQFLDDYQEGLSLADYEDFLKKNMFKNRKFYQNLLNELSGAIYNSKQNSHTAAFVHIYRAYEYLAYSFPMVYAAKTGDFIGSFSKLSAWINQNAKDKELSELAFHKQFISTLFKDTSEISMSIDVHIRTKEEFKPNIFNGLATKVLGWKNSTSYTPNTVYPEKLSIPFTSFHSFIVTLRNRFFHYSNGRSDNIGHDDIIDSNSLFELVNGAALRFIAIIFHGVVSYEL
jgi:hypothetical protein